ncbi:MAG: hypothetical protein M1834_008785 [Cirrosporium novae-zelandiae]|nr:MAG: hypothetical protein M1834_008785 [Cirrosporium novae-zelandiae]
MLVIILSNHEFTVARSMILDQYQGIIRPAAIIGEHLFPLIFCAENGNLTKAAFKWKVDEDYATTPSISLALEAYVEDVEVSGALHDAHIPHGLHHV